jgi:uncharacterized membrane protein
MNSNSSQTESVDKKNESSQLFSRERIRSYLVVMLGMFVITALYHILIGNNVGNVPRNQPGNAPGNPLGGPIGNPPGNGGVPIAGFDIWPLWGQFVLPDFLGISMVILIIIMFSGVVLYLRKKNTLDLHIPVIIFVGIVLTILTSLIQGWETGIINPIGGQSEILVDALQIGNPLSFIMNFEEIQSTLTIHAQTQPPGAVLVIYLFYVIFQNPGLISIALCIISSVFSVYFMNGVYVRLFDEQLSKYAVFLFVLLPAIQVYYLANIYAIVSTLVLGLLYFYFHSNKTISITGSFLCLFLGTFISFLFVYTVLFLFIFELLQFFNRKSDEPIQNRVKSFLTFPAKLVGIYIGVASVYIGMAIFLDFNYITAFLYATSSENPNGFMLIANPLEYFITRIQDVLDILIFFGPILTALCYEGFMWLKKNKELDDIVSTKYNLVLSSLVALLLLFLTGAPKKGETARICMFILPLLLIPVITLLQSKNVTWREKVLLISVVFAQAVLMQTIGVWLW